MEDPKLGSALAKTETKPSQIDTKQLLSLIEAIREKLDNLTKVINGGSPTGLSPSSPTDDVSEDPQGEKVVIGIFNGRSMTGNDTKDYSVPPNYASKSKMVEGDELKLTIRQNGSFLYKQIGPVPRKRLTGILGYNESNRTWHVTVDDRQYTVLQASITFYKGSIGNEVVIIVPEAGGAEWAAVDNIISSTESNKS